MDPNRKLRQAVRRFAERETPNPVGSIAAIYDRYALELGDEIATLQVVRSQLLEMAKHSGPSMSSNHGGRSTPKKKSAKKKTAAVNGMTQGDVALKILKLAKHPLTSTDIEARMQEAGVTTEAKEFRAVVWTLLRTMENKKLIRGRRRKGQPKIWTAR